MSALPIRRGKSQNRQKGPCGNKKEEHSVCNYDPYIETKVKTIDLKLGQIPNTYESSSVAPGHGFGEGSSLNWLKHGCVCVCVGGGGEPISEISLNLIISQEEKSSHFNLHNNNTAMPGKPPAKGSLSSYQNKDIEQIADELVSIWGRLKAYSPVYQGVARAIT